jgi:transcriptional regulator with PAS, ATPase and Fis domain
MTEIYRLTEELEKSKEKLNQYSEIVKTLTAKQIIEDGGIFKSPQMEKIIDNILKFAKVEAPVLITGESGVGKEVVADLIYKHGTRNSSPFIKINCAAIPETLLESELFGYEGGSFSGAKKEGKRGLLELADSGTVLLDEIGEIAAPIQAKLLRFIQNKEFYRIGGKHVIKVDVRVIAATNQSLEEMVKEKMFRMDLFYRLNVLSIHIPPLRERPADIIPMANYFLRKYSQKYKTNKILAPEIYLIFTNYAWNGNIRELENLMERLIVTCDKYEITAEYLPEHIRKVSQNLNIVKPYTPLTYAQAKAQFEKNFFGEAIAKYKTSRKVAENLQVDHSTVVKKSQKYGLKLLSWEKNG